MPDLWPTAEPPVTNLPLVNARRRFVSLGAAAALVAAACPALAGERDPHPGEPIQRPHPLLDSLRAAALSPFLTDWPLANERRPVSASALPVLRWLPDVKANAPALTLELVNEMCRAAPAMAWRQSYTATEIGAAFLENYGY